MERQDAIERSHAETFRRARKGRRQANRAKGEPVKLRIAAGLRERDLAQGAVSTDGKINQRLTLKMKARRASGGNPLDRKSTRLNSVTNAHLVCRLLLEKKNMKQDH